MKIQILSTLMLFASMSVFAQNEAVILPAPDFSEPSASVIETLRTRHSVRSFDSSRQLLPQQVSNLCWAACGVTRDGEHRTSPTAINRQEIRLFVFDEKGVYEYLAKANALRLCAEGDHRRLVAGTPERMQEFVLDAPLSLVMVIDLEKFGMDDERAVIMGAVDAGNVSENVNLYCQSVGLATVPRATMDAEAIRVLLGLTEKQIPVMNNPVGYEKK